MAVSVHLFDAYLEWLAGVDGGRFLSQIEFGIALLDNGWTPDETLIDMSQITHEIADGSGYLSWAHWYSSGGTVPKTLVPVDAVFTAGVVLCDLPDAVWPMITATAAYAVVFTRGSPASPNPTQNGLLFWIDLDGDQVMAAQSLSIVFDVLGVFGLAAS